MLDEILFELSHIATYLSVADLMRSHTEGQYGFSYAHFLPNEEKEDVYINFKGLWHTSSGTKEIPDEISIDGKRHHTLVITGYPYYHQCTINSSVCRSVLAAQTLGIVPAKEGTLTPVSLIWLFTNPREYHFADKTSLERELETIKLHSQLLTACHASGQKTLTCYDENLLSKTTCEVSDSLQYAMITNHMETYPRNAQIILSDNTYLINLLYEKHPSIMQVRITPSFVLKKDIVDRELFFKSYRKIVGNRQIASKAEEIVEVIKKNKKQAVGKM